MKKSLFIGLTILTALVMVLVNSYSSDSIRQGSTEAARLAKKATSLLLDGRDGYRAVKGRPIPISLLEAAALFQQSLILSWDEATLEKYLITLDEIAVYVGRSDNNFAALTYLHLAIESERRGGYSSDIGLDTARACWMLDRKSEFDRSIQRLSDNGFQDAVMEAQPWLKRE